MPVSIDLTTLPPAVQRILGPGAPPAMKAMAAGGVAPGLKPGDVLTVLAVLTDDADPEAATRRLERRTHSRSRAGGPRAPRGRLRDERRGRREAAQDAAHRRGRPRNPRRASRRKDRRDR